MKYTFSRKQLAVPYAAFLVLFVVLPLLVVIITLKIVVNGKNCLINIKH